MSMPKKSRILSYWFEGTKKGYQRFGFVDIGEPMCWACERPFDFSESTEPKLRWNNADLERCHIIPQSLDGEDSPENLALLCYSCHVQSPDTINKQPFFTFVKSKKTWHREECESLMNELKRYNLDEQYSEGQLLEALESDDFKQFFIENSGIHQGISKSTFVAVLSEFLSDE